MNRARLNFIIDSLSLGLGVLLAATGLILKTVLPPGSGRWPGEGVGAHGGRRTVALLWHLSRHEWGAIHFYIAIALMAVLCAHVILHGRWIVCMVKAKPPEGSGVRLAIGLLCAALLLGLAAAPFFSDVVQVRN